MIDYLINPVKMGGLVKEVSDGNVKVHLHGRLGVITVPERLVISSIPVEPGCEMEFYFSYIQIVENPYDYDSSDMTADHEPEPCLLGGTLSEVNDTAAGITIMNDLGIIRVPRRWLFTPVPLQEGQEAEFYFSCMKVVGKKDIPAEFI